MGFITAKEFTAAQANPAPAAGDSVETLLMKLATQTAPAIAHNQISDEDTFEFEAGKHYSVAIVSGTATFTGPTEEGAEPPPPLEVELPAGMVTGRFNVSTYVSVAAGADSVVVIETYNA